MITIIAERFQKTFTEDFKEQLKQALDQGEGNPTLDHIVYTKFLELGTNDKVVKWLQDQGHKYLGHRKFTSKGVSETLIKREPSTSPIINQAVKQARGYNMEDDWWNNWDTLTYEQKNEYIASEIFEAMYSKNSAVGKKLYVWDSVYRKNKDNIELHKLSVDKVATEYIIPAIKNHLI